MKALERLFFRRPRILNQLHRLRLVSATSQTNDDELSALARYSSGAKRALEIGTYQGVSAARIASRMAEGGELCCVDPWPTVHGQSNPCWLICERHLRRNGVVSRIQVLRGFSREVTSSIPYELDFAFIDGDHSHSGLETDWNIVYPRIRPTGVICLHDTIIPMEEPWRRFGSARFYEEVIARDSAFETIETVHSMAIVRKLKE